MFIYKAVYRCRVPVLLDANTFIVGGLFEAPSEAPEDEAIIAVIGGRRIHIASAV